MFDFFDTSLSINDTNPSLNLVGDVNSYYPKIRFSGVNGKYGGNMVNYANEFWFYTGSGQRALKMIIGNTVAIGTTTSGNPNAPVNRSVSKDHFD